MIKTFIICTLVVSALSAPQGGSYAAPAKHFDNRGSFSNQFHRKDSGERFGGGFDSKERFGGGASVGGSGFQQASGQRYSGGSSERFGGGFSGEVRGDGGFVPRPIGGGFDVRQDYSASPRVSGGFGGFSGEARGPVIAILREERQDPINGEYSFLYETEDGVLRQESGSPVGPEGATIQQGSWSFTYPDGTPADFRFIADENGYQVESSLLPVPPPLPPHAIAQIEKAERERAAGIIHDGQYREEDHFGGGFAPAPQAGPRYSSAPAPAPGPVSFPAPGSGAFRASGRPLGPPQGFHGGFKDSSRERPSSFRGDDDRFQSSFEVDHFSSAQPQRFGGGGLQPQPVGVSLSAANQRSDSRREFQGSRRTYN